MAASMLVPVPLENQLQDPNTDGAPDVNARWNCVPTTLAAAGKALVGWRLSGGDLHDAVYGRAYTGATDPLRYRAFLAQHGLAIGEVRANSGDALVAAARAHLAQGQPVYGAIPSQWGLVTAAQVAANPSLPTHAVMLCDWTDADGGMLTAMNPWPVDGAHAFYQRMPAAWWASRLVYGHVLPIARTAGGGPVSTVTSVWSAANGGSLAYPAHDGLPALTLTHAQAYYAHDNRAGQYPVRVGYLTKTGGASRSYVLWSDGLATSADSDEGWTVRADRTGEVLTVVLGQLDAVAAADASRIAQLSQQVQTLQQQVQTLQSQQGNGNGKLPLATLRPVLANLIVAQQALARGTAAVNDARALAGKLVG